MILQPTALFIVSPFLDSLHRICWPLLGVVDDVADLHVEGPVLRVELLPGGLQYLQHKAVWCDLPLLTPAPTLAPTTVPSGSSVMPSASPAWPTSVCILARVLFIVTSVRISSVFCLRMLTQIGEQCLLLVVPAVSAGSCCLQCCVASHSCS